MGGDLGGGAVSDEIYIYDPYQDIIKETGEDLSTGVMAASAIYDATMLFGGFDDGGSHINGITHSDTVLHHFLTDSLLNLSKHLRFFCY